MKKFICGLFIFFVLAGCSNDDDYGEVNIRIFNASEVEFKDVKFDPSTRLVNFGDLGPNQYTQYENFERAYDYAYFSLMVNDSTYVLQPTDYVGETPLGKGNYTYRINFNNDDTLVFTLVED